MSNGQRRPRHSQPFRHHQRRQHQPPRLYSIGWCAPDGGEIEITIDINDPNADPLLLDLIHQMTDNCPHCNGDQEHDDNGRH